MYHVPMLTMHVLKCTNNVKRVVCYFMKKSVLYISVENEKKHVENAKLQNALKREK